MRYPKEFENLIETTQENLIGWGNPNAKILIIGCEPAIRIDNLEQNKREIVMNRKQWIINNQHLLLLKQWIKDKDPQNNPCKSFEYGYLNYNPRHPYCYQINTSFPQKGGTSRTWWLYQKLVDKVRGITKKHRNLDLFDYAFITDLSDVNAPKSKDVDYKTKKDAIFRRKESLFSQPFFRSFPIVIVACGHYVRDFDLKLNEIFDIPYIKLDSNEGWINYHKSEDNTRVLLHTLHFTARGLKVNDYIDDIVEGIKQ